MEQRRFGKKRGGGGTSGAQHGEGQEGGGVEMGTHTRGVSANIRGAGYIGDTEKRGS